MYRQNQKEEQISFVLICRVSNKKQIYARQMAFQDSFIPSFWFFQKLQPLYAVPVMLVDNSELVNKS